MKDICESDQSDQSDSLKNSEFIKNDEIYNDFAEELDQEIVNLPEDDADLINYKNYISNMPVAPISALESKYMNLIGYKIEILYDPDILKNDQQNGQIYKYDTKVQVNLLKFRNISFIGHLDTSKNQQNDQINIIDKSFKTIYGAIYYVDNNIYFLPSDCGVTMKYNEEECVGQFLPLRDIDLQYIDNKHNYDAVNKIQNPIKYLIKKGDQIFIKYDFENNLKKTNCQNRIISFKITFNNIYIRGDKTAFIDDDFKIYTHKEHVEKCVQEFCDKALQDPFFNFIQKFVQASVQVSVKAVVQKLGEKYDEEFIQNCIIKYVHGLFEKPALNAIQEFGQEFYQEYGQKSVLKFVQEYAQKPVQEFIKESVRISVKNFVQNKKEKPLSMINEEELFTDTGQIDNCITGKQTINIESTEKNKGDKDSAYQTLISESVALFQLDRDHAIFKDADHYCFDNQIIKNLKNQPSSESILSSILKGLQIVKKKAETHSFISVNRIPNCIIEESKKSITTNTNIDEVIKKNKELIDQIHNLDRRNNLYYGLNIVVTIAAIIIIAIVLHSLAIDKYVSKNQ